MIEKVSLMYDNIGDELNCSVVDPSRPLVLPDKIEFKRIAIPCMDTRFREDKPYWICFHKVCDW